MKGILFLTLPLFILLLTLAEVRASENSNPQISFNPLKTGTQFFQTFISPVDGPRCSMVPTCSGYAIEAAEEHGFFLGVLLTVDRLLHEVEVDFHTKPKHVSGRIRWEDPVSDNTFWWQADSTAGERP